MKVSRLIPAWTKEYRSGDFRFDLVAGLTVGVMLIPQAMGYAMLAGLPPIYGLFASAVPPVMYALFGTCRQLSVGPGAIVSLLTASGIGLVAQAGSHEYLALVALLSLTVGLIQLCFGVARLGFLVHFLSSPVIIGFTSAAVIIIAFSQLRLFLGIPLVKSQYLHELLMAIISQISSIHLLTLGIGLGGLSFLILAQKYFPTFPAPLTLLVVSIVITWLFRLDTHGVSIIGEIPTGLPVPSLPRMDAAGLLAILSTAFAIALISFMESSAVARRIQMHHPGHRVIPDKELMALGLSNIMSAVFRTMPITGGITRSTVNEQAGARSGLASIITSIVIILVLLFLARTFHYLPHAILAAVILAAVRRLVHIKDAARLWSVDRKDFWMMLVTFFGTLFLGISIGIGIGVVLSLGWIIFESSYPHHAELGRIPGTHSFRNVRRFQHLEVMEGILIFRFDAQLFFANASHFREVLLDYKGHRKDAIHSVIVDMESINSIDSTAIEMLSDLIRELRLEHIRLYLAEVKGPVRDRLYASGLVKDLGENNFFVTVEEAIRHISGRGGAFLHDAAMQTNVPRP